MFRTATMKVLFVFLLIKSLEYVHTQKKNEIIENFTIINEFTTMAMLNYTTREDLKRMNALNRSHMNNFSSKSQNSSQKMSLRKEMFCYHLQSINRASRIQGCPFDFDKQTDFCWEPVANGSMASTIIKHDYGAPYLHTSYHGIRNCTIERYCNEDGTWSDTISPEIQCKVCPVDAEPVKFNSISIIIETASLAVSLISLTVAMLCMMSIKRLHLPRNLLHMHLFIAFILRCIVKLTFIHTIVSGYPRYMITYTFDKCGHIEILSITSNFFHIISCRLLTALFWYSDAAAQTFVFCEAMFLFTALTSHLFRDRGCIPFVLWGWLSPIIWISMWMTGHIIMDRLEERSSCWLEGDYTVYFYYFFYVPYAAYLLINLGIFIFLVRLLYSKYQSLSTQSSRSGNRQLIKSILILIPLFGLHSLLVMWIFYRKKEGHTILYYVTVIFKATVGDLQGFFASLIYFYFNAEIRSEVCRQIQRRLLNNDVSRLSSTGETWSTRLSTFRRSLSRHRQASLPSRFERQRSFLSSNKTSTPKKDSSKTRDVKCSKCLSTSWIKKSSVKKTSNKDILKSNPIEDVFIKPTTPPFVYDVKPEERIANRRSSTLGLNVPTPKTLIDADTITCDTTVVRNEHEDDLLSDENEVTIHLSSINADPISTITPTYAPRSFSHISKRLVRSNGDICCCKTQPLDTKSLQ